MSVLPISRHPMQWAFHTQGLSKASDDYFLSSGVSIFPPAKKKKKKKGMYTPKAGPDLSLSVSQGGGYRGYGVTEFLNSQEQGRDDAGRGGSMVDREALITMSCG